MKAGNHRFASFHPAHPDESPSRSRAISQQQHPMAVVIACSDSRVPPELVFDEGLGDLFVIRTAGHVLSDLELGSVEYAVEHLKVPLVVVLGHERCGAVQAMISGELPRGHIKAIIDSLKSEEEISAVPLTDHYRLEHCIQANIWHAVHALHRSPMLAAATKEGRLKIIGARYDLDDRQVQFLGEE